MLGKGVVYAITYMGKEKISGGRQANRFNIEEIGVADVVDETEEEGGSDDSKVDKK